MSNDNVLDWPLQPTRMIEVDPRPQGAQPREVLEGALERADGFQAVVITGINADGSLFLGTTTENVADIIFTLERVKTRLLQTATKDRFG